MILSALYVVSRGLQEGYSPTRCAHAMNKVRTGRRVVRSSCRCWILVLLTGLSLCACARDGRYQLVVPKGGHCEAYRLDTRTGELVCLQFLTAWQVDPPRDPRLAALRAALEATPAPQQP